jgi:hypothetical protein
MHISVAPHDYGLDFTCDRELSNAPSEPTTPLAFLGMQRCTTGLA